MESYDESSIDDCFHSAYFAEVRERELTFRKTKCDMGKWWIWFGFVRLFVVYLKWIGEGVDYFFCECATNEYFKFSYKKKYLF